MSPVVHLVTFGHRDAITLEKGERGGGRKKGQSMMILKNWNEVQQTIAASFRLCPLHASLPYSRRRTCLT